MEEEEEEEEDAGLPPSRCEMRVVSFRLPLIPTNAPCSVSPLPRRVFIILLAPGAEAMKTRGPERKRKRA